MRNLMTAAAALTIAFAFTAPARANDAAEGEKVFKRVCAACHIPTAEGPKRLGPTLFGLVGRKSGSIEGFRYSEGNKKVNLTWTPDILEKYLENPKAVVPGTTMAFAGLKKHEEREHVIAYLKTLK